MEYCQNAADAGAIHWRLSTLKSLMDSAFKQTVMHAVDLHRSVTTEAVKVRGVSLPCVASGVVKTNMSAKMVAPVSDKRRGKQI